MRARSAIPELPEVETVRRELEPWLTGRRILEVERLAPPGPKYRGLERAPGQTIRGVTRRGKFLLMPLDGNDVLVLHLGMTGVVSPASAGDAMPAHVRVRMRLDGSAPCWFVFDDVRRFGRLLLTEAGDYAGLPTLAALGPEPLSDDFSVKGFRAALAGSSMAVKTFLLSQRPVAGVGNIYADEALWRARIHPETPASAVSARRAAALHGAIREVLAASLEARGTTLNDYRTVNGEVGAYLEELEVYGHADEPCRRCGSTLHRSVVGQRGTVFCPRCQRRVR